MSSEFFLLFLFALFTIGAVAIHIISRKKEKPEKISAWKKFFVYFFIIYSIFLCILYVPELFRAICFLVALGGAFEIVRLQLKSHQRLAWSKFCLYFLMYIALAVLFLFFAFESVEIQILTVFAECTFDACSQLSGQLFGQRKIAPRISPNKTLGGLVGGACLALILGVVANFNSEFGLIVTTIILIFCVVAASFVGDLLASYVKRQ
jgi:phosphatidate cytidylyltransferase